MTENTVTVTPDKWYTMQCTFKIGTAGRIMTAYGVSVYACPTPIWEDVKRLLKRVWREVIVERLNIWKL